MKSNPLLEAIEYNDIQLFVRYLENTTATDIKAHILDLLEKQRELCAQEASVNCIETPLEYLKIKYMVDKESINQAKLI